MLRVLTLLNEHISNPSRSANVAVAGSLIIVIVTIAASLIFNQSRNRVGQGADVCML